MTRNELIKAIEARGWQSKLYFGGDGPYINVYGVAGIDLFDFYERVPVRLLDDHSIFWRSLCLHLLKGLN